MSIETLEVGDISVAIHRKDIKNLHIGVYPPRGHVRVAAPVSISSDAIRVAVLEKMSWIRRKQNGFQNQERQSPRRNVSGETHYLFGRPLRLSVVAWSKNSHKIQRRGNDQLELVVPHDSTADARERWMQNWYRLQLRRAAEPRIAHWAERLDVSPKSWGIRVMKTKWGSCNPEKKTIWLNAELSRKPTRAIDYVILHELAHLVSPTHDEIFLEVLDGNMPSWRQVRSELNALPLSAWV